MKTTHKVSHFLRPKKSFYIETCVNDYIGNRIKSSASFYEIHVLERCFCLFGRPSRVLDVGANIGNHTLFWAGVMGAGVVAVEPHPIIADLLRRNVRKNGLESRVKILNVACGAGSAVVSMEIPDPQNMGTSRIVSGSQRGNDTFMVQQTTLDEACMSRGDDQKFDLVKIDTEGSEYEVLRGALKLLEKDKPNLWVEASEQSREGCFEILKSIGYRSVVGPVGFSDNYFFSEKRGRPFSKVRSRIYGSIDRGRLAVVGRLIR